MGSSRDTEEGEGHDDDNVEYLDADDLLETMEEVEDIGLGGDLQVLHTSILSMHRHHGVRMALNR